MFPLDIENSDSWMADLLVDYMDDRITIGISFNEKSQKLYAVRIEDKVIATGSTVKDAVWNARKELACRKVRTTMLMETSTPEAIARTLKYAARYLDDVEYSSLLSEVFK